MKIIELSKVYIVQVLSNAINVVITGVGFTDSPAGHLSWLLQMIVSGTKKNSIHLPDGELSVYTKEELLDNAMLYWSQNNIISASLILP